MTGASAVSKFPKDRAIRAVTEMARTLAPTIALGALAGSAFILGLGLLCSVFDLAYLGLLLWARRGLGLPLGAEAAVGAPSATSLQTSD